MAEAPAELWTQIEGFLSQLAQERRVVTDVRERSEGPQGYSGSQIRYYDVLSRDPQGRIRHDAVVSKNAVLLERRILALLAEQGCAVPPLYLPDGASDGRAPVYMPHLEPLPPSTGGHPPSAVTLSVADGLAGIHAANRGHKPAWLPPSSDDFLGRLYLRAWRHEWETCLAQPDFYQEFGAYTRRLELALEGLVRTLEALCAEQESLTLLNVDLHPGHIWWWQGQACFIDWEQSSYGPLYLDLPNHFTIETALAYRDALARHGYEIPVVEFMERYHEVGHYMGLRYLEAALVEWQAGGERRRQGRWFLYYTFSLALHGR